MLKPSTFWTALQSKWCNCPFYKHTELVTGPRPHVPPRLKWSLISIWKWALHIIKLRWDPELDTHKCLRSHAFFNADVPALHLFFFFCLSCMFSIYYTWPGVEIIRFQPSVSGTDTNKCSCAAMTNVNPAPYKGQQISEFQSRLTQFYMKCNTGTMSSLAVLSEAYWGFPTQCNAVWFLTSTTILRQCHSQEFCI